MREASPTSVKLPAHDSSYGAGDARIMHETRGMLQTDQQFPSVSSHSKGMKVNGDGYVDVYFGPEAPAGLENNWVQTIPGKDWFLRLYGPLEAWFNKTWRPGEIEQQG